MKKISKSEAKEQIEEFFKNIKSKTPKEIRKTKRLAMNYNIPLKEKRKLFCRNCFEPYLNSKIRIKKGKKIILCNYCGNISRWKLK